MGCWNVTTLETPLAAEHLEAALSNYRYDVIALSETHTLGQDTRLDGRLFLSGGDSRYAGVGVLLSVKAKRSLVSVHCLSNRIMAACLNIKGGMLLLVAVYAPTSAAPDDEIDSFYQDLERWVADNHKMREQLVIAGDFNAKLGCERVDSL